MKKTDELKTLAQEKANITGKVQYYCEIHDPDNDSITRHVRSTPIHTTFSSFYPYGVDKDERN